MAFVVGSSWGASTTASSAALAAQKKPEALGSQVGDIIIVTAAQERSGLPVLNLSNLTQIRKENLGTDAVYVGWKRLTSSDLSATISVSSDSNASRRMMIGYIVIRNGKDPVASMASRSSGPTGAHPNITPSTNNALLVSSAAIFSHVEPYLRTIFSAAGWTEQVSAGSAQSTAINSYVHISTKQVDNGKDISQTGNIVSDDSGEKFVSYCTSIVVEHSLAASPLTIDLGVDQTIIPFSQASVTAVTSGGFNPTNKTWSQISGPTIATTVSGDSISFMAPPSLNSQAYVFRYSALDDGATVTKDVTINVLPHGLVVRRGGNLKFVEKLQRRGSILIGTGRNIPIPGAAEDSTPPQIAISSPASNATISGVINLNGTVADFNPDTTAPVLSIVNPPADSPISGRFTISGSVSD